MAYPYNGRVEVDHAAQTQCLEFSPNGRNKKQNKRRWVMIDENNDCITKSELIIKVKTLRRYNDRSKVQPNKQTSFSLFWLDHNIFLEY